MQVLDKASQRIINRLLLVFLTFFAIPVYADDAKKVIIMVGEEGPGGCELLGRVIGTSKESETDTGNAPYIERLMKARNSLTAETFKLGGNTVHITQSNNTGKYEIPGTDKEIIHIGNAYRCK